MNEESSALLQKIAILTDASELIECVVSSVQKIDDCLRDILRELRSSSSDKIFIAYPSYKLALINLAKATVLVSLTLSHPLVDVFVELVLQNYEKKGVDWPLSCLYILLQQMPEETGDEETFMTCLGFQQLELNKHVADQSLENIHEFMKTGIEQPEAVREISHLGAPLLLSERNAMVAEVILSNISSDLDINFLKLLSGVYLSPQSRMNLWLSQKNIMMEQLCNTIHDLLKRPFISDSDMEDKLDLFAAIAAQHSETHSEIFAMFRCSLVETRSYLLCRIMYTWNKSVLKKTKHLEVSYVELFAHSFRSLVSIFSSSPRTPSALHEIILLLRKLSSSNHLQFLWCISCLFLDWLPAALVQALHNNSSPDHIADAVEYVAWIIEPADSQLQLQAREQCHELVSHIRAVRAGSSPIRPLKELAEAYAFLQRFCVLEIQVLYAGSTTTAMQTTILQLLEERMKNSPVVGTILLRALEQLALEASKHGKSSPVASICETCQSWFRSNSSPQFGLVEDAIRRLDRCIELCPQQVTVIELD